LSNPEAKFILLSDFNQLSLIWYLYSLPLTCDSQIDSYFTSMLSNFNLNQFSLIRNHNNVILDLALSNVHVDISNDSHLLLLIDKHNLALNISSNYEQLNTLPIHDIIYDLITAIVIKLSNILVIHSILAFSI